MLVARSPDASPSCRGEMSRTGQCSEAAKVACWAFGRGAVDRTCGVACHAGVGSVQRSTCGGWWCVVGRRRRAGGPGPRREAPHRRVCRRVARSPAVISRIEPGRRAEPVPAAQAAEADYVRAHRYWPNLPGSGDRARREQAFLRRTRWTEPRRNGAARAGPNVTAGRSCAGRVVPDDFPIIVGRIRSVRE